MVPSWPQIEARLRTRVKEVREEAYVWWLATLTPLLKEGFTLSTLPEVQVDGEAAVGVKVVSKGHADTRMYFRKRNGLLARIDRRTAAACCLRNRRDQLFTGKIPIQRVLNDFSEFARGLWPAGRLLREQPHDKLVDLRNFCERRVALGRHIRHCMKMLIKPAFNVLGLERQRSNQHLVQNDAK